MLTSIALIMLCGLLMGGLAKKLRLPPVIGMLVTGVILGPSALNLLDGSILGISADLRKIALIIILLKAGLGLDIGVLKKVGRPALLLCFLPASFEILGWVLLAPRLLGITVLEAGIIGAVMGAVSPAVVVPRMTRLMEEGWGTDKGIPQMIIAGASADDVFVIVVFTALTGLAQGGSVSVMSFGQIPVSIVTGILLGLGTGWVFCRFFRRVHMRDTVKLVILLSTAFLFISLENALEGALPVSGLLAVMSMGVCIYNGYDVLAKRLSGKFAKLWVPAELMLFVLVGASVDVRAAVGAGWSILLLLAVGLVFRLVGCWLSLLGTDLNRKEQLFTVLSALPKATVQAAIGGVPLSLGLSCGSLVLTVAVVSILVTAPLGAIAIDLAYPRCLTHTIESEEGAL